MRTTRLVPVLLVLGAGCRGYYDYEDLEIVEVDYDEVADALDVVITGADLPAVHAAALYAERGARPGGSAIEEQGFSLEEDGLSWSFRVVCAGSDGDPVPCGEPEAQQAEVDFAWSSVEDEPSSHAEVVRDALWTLDDVQGDRPALSGRSTFGLDRTTQDEGLVRWLALDVESTWDEVVLAPPGLPVGGELTLDLRLVRETDLGSRQAVQDVRVDALVRFDADGAELVLDEDRVYRLGDDVDDDAMLEGVAAP